MIAKTANETEIQNFQDRDSTWDKAETSSKADHGERGHQVEKILTPISKCQRKSFQQYCIIEEVDCAPANHDSIQQLFPHKCGTF